MNQVRHIINSFIKKDLALEKLEKIDFEGRKIFKSFALAHIGTAKILIDLQDKQAKYFIKAKLNTYKNFKKKLIGILIELGLLKRIKIKVPKNIGLIFLSNRIKLFDFKGKFIYTIDHKNNHIKKSYSLLKKNKIEIPELKFKKQYILEKLLFPNEEIKEEEIIKIFRILFKLYKKTFKKESQKEFIRLINKSYNYNLKEILGHIKKLPTYSSVIVHGDFCRPNIVKKREKYYLIDIENTRRALILEDFIRFFESEYNHTKKINKRIFNSLKNMFKRELLIPKKEFNRLVLIQLEIMKKRKNLLFRKKIIEILK